MGAACKLVLALAIGYGALTAAQHLWVSAMTERIAAVSQTPSLPSGPIMPAMQLNAEQLTKGLMPTAGRIDTSEGQRLAVEGAARRIDIQNRNALSHVPLPPGPSGIPRH